MDEPTRVKVCTRCQIAKPCSEFGKRTAAADGLYSQCKACRKVERAAYYVANKPKVDAAVAGWRAANPEKVVAGVTAWKKANPDKAKRYARVGYERNRDRALATTRAWQKANPERFAEILARRRARLRNATVGDVDLRALWATQEGRCGLCDEPIDPTLIFPHPMSKSVDHIIPLSRGGMHEQSNLQWTHLVENQRKGASVPDSHL